MVVVEVFEIIGDVISCVTNANIAKFGALSLLCAAGFALASVFCVFFLRMPCNCIAGCLLGCFYVILIILYYSHAY